MSSVTIQVRLCFTFISYIFQNNAIVKKRLVYDQPTHVRELTGCLWCYQGSASAVAITGKGDSFDFLLFVYEFSAFDVDQSHSLLRKTYL